MNWFDAFKFIIKFLPCVLMVFKEVDAAKKDDGTVDLEEIAVIVEKFVNCIVSKLDVKK